MTREVAVPLALCVLALLDGAFAGFRASAGHEARLPERRANLMAAAWGVGLGAAGLCVIALVTVPFLAPEETRQVRFDEYVDAGRWMLVFYVPMALVTLIAVAVHVFVRDHELSAVAMTVVLGPVTLVRPLVIGAGAATAGAAADRAAVWLAAATAVVVTVGVGPAIRRLRYAPR